MIYMGHRLKWRWKHLGGTMGVTVYFLVSRLQALLTFKVKSEDDAPEDTSEVA